MAGLGLLSRAWAAGIASSSSTAAVAETRGRSSPRSASEISISTHSSRIAKASSGGPRARSRADPRTVSSVAPAIGGASSGGGDAGPQVQHLTAVLRPVQAGRMPRGDRGGGEFVRRQSGRGGRRLRTAGRTRPASRRAPAWRCPAAVATPTDSSTSRRSMSTNRPDSGRLDQSALAVTWNSTTRPAPFGISVTSGVPSSSAAQVRAGQIGGGFGEDLAVDLDFIGDLQAGERRGWREGRQTGRLAPGHRAAQLAVAGEQSHRQQRCRCRWSAASAVRGPAKRISSPPLRTQPSRASRSGPACSGRSARIRTEMSRFSSVAASPSRSSVNGSSARFRK